MIKRSLQAIWALVFMLLPITSQGQVAAGSYCQQLRANAGSKAAVVEPVITFQQLRSACYIGIEGLPAHQACLKDGHWEGEPPQPGSASVPRLDLLGDLQVRGDLDTDGKPEAAAVLTFSFGGTGVFHYLAVMRGGLKGPVNTATEPIGDRIQIIDACVDRNSVVLDLVRAGPKDPSCCPGEVVSLAYSLVGNKLSAGSLVLPPGRLSVDTVGKASWHLEQWKANEAAPSGITLAMTTAGLRGRAACNNYSAPLIAGDSADAIRIGPAITTRMACEPDAMQAERRFLAQLSQVTRFRFHAGKLVLDYGSGTDLGSMVFVRQH